MSKLCSKTLPLTYLNEPVRHCPIGLVIKAHRLVGGLLTELETESATYILSYLCLGSVDTAN